MHEQPQDCPRNPVISKHTPHNQNHASFGDECAGVCIFSISVLMFCLQLPLAEYA
ncbi:MAG: hypothetical protein H6R04_2178 [Burkholderiaceae bacterium]|nr:hypothetical protein [Burkholderiaceae bacterium]